MADATPPPEALKSVRKGMSIATVVVVAVAAFIAGYGTHSALAPASGPAAPKIYVLGTNTPFPPFESLDANETIVGFDIDLIGAILHNAGKTYTLKDFRDFSALLASVNTHRVDIAVSAITSSGTTGATRNGTMSFSTPYYESDQAVLVRHGYTGITCQADPTGCTATDIGNLKIAAQAGTSSEFWVSDNVANASAQMTTFPDVTQVLEALRTSSVDIVVIDKPAGDGIVAANPSLYTIAGTIQTNELYSFAVPKGDPDGLLPIINGQLTAMKADGTYNQILHKWF
jgi:ABC-type amino acid transport substrate-binding protein